MYQKRYTLVAEAAQLFLNQPPTLRLDHRSRIVAGASLEVSRAEMAGGSAHVPRAIHSNTFE